jgi:hypothetical protein
MHMGSIKLITATLTLLALGACSSSPDKEVAEIESRLSAAGFELKLADTPEKLAHLKTMGQRRLFPISRDGDMVFIYADAQGCKCIYVGSQKNYQEYQRLAIQQHVVDEQHVTAEENQMAAETNAQMTWDVWNLWPGPVVY